MFEDCFSVVTINQDQQKLYVLSKEALEVLKGPLTNEELGFLFEDKQFSPELEEYLFECMDNTDLTYVEVVKEQLSRLEIQIV